MVTTWTSYLKFLLEPSSCFSVRILLTVTTMLWNTNCFRTLIVLARGDESTIRQMEGGSTLS